MHNFYSMTRPQAEAYLEVFLGEMAACRERLAATLERQGGDPGWVEDPTPASLDPMWETLLPLLAWQDGYHPDPERPEIGPTVEALGDLDALPSWLWDNSVAIGLSPESIWIVDGLGRHLGNLLVAANPGLRWAVGRHRIRVYVNQNHPVITTNPGHADDQHPLESVAVAARQHLDSSPRARTLRQLHDGWVRWAAEGN